MELLDFSQNSLTINGTIFAVAAVVVWFAGVRLTGAVDAFAERTGIGKAFAGALFLGGATSLPEIATTVTASWSGAAELAGANLFGGIAMQMTVLAVVDGVALRKRALSSFSPTSTVLLQGVMLLFLLSMATMAVISGELLSFGHVGLWPILLAVAYVVVLWITQRHEGDPRWLPHGEQTQPPESARDMKDREHEGYERIPMTGLVVRFSAYALAILAGGYFVARTGEAIAEQTGLGAGLVGALLVALATSLPEVSTTWSAVRFGAYSMAAGSILGTNCLELALFLPADLAYSEGLIFDAMQPSIAFLATAGSMTAAAYVWGILERRDRTVFGFGIDSAAVIVIYVFSVTVYYFVQM